MKSKLTPPHTLIIAEAGVNHNGTLKLALELCDAAREAGADVVKFQTFRAEDVTTASVAEAAYQSDNIGVTESQQDMLRRLQLPYEDFATLKAHCDDIGITFASTACDPKGLDLLVNLKVPFLKIGSSDVTNFLLLEAAGRSHLPVIFSTGMSTLGEVEAGVRLLERSGCTDLTLLHCTTSYPCPPQDVNLKAMLTLKTAFGYPVGYSDHTEGLQIPLAAVALGACVIEKHFTLDRKLPGPDHKASIEPHELKELVKEIRALEQALGDGIKRPTATELEIREVVEKRLVAACPISAGEIFNADNIVVKRSTSGLSATQYHKLLGSISPRDFAADEGIVLP
ncbi:MAG: N-acetylneuraminate synthase [Succinivibrio sp.]|nr:N-acetylneuraminate synthase [Succinivibrio sp.]